MTAVATEIEALSPSVPSRDPTNCTWISWFEMSSPVYFLMRAGDVLDRFLRDISRRPVAMIRPALFSLARASPPQRSGDDSAEFAIELSPMRPRVH